MEDYKGHVGAPAKCHILYGKCTAWKQLSICTSCKVTWGVFCWADGGSVKKNQSSKPLTGEKKILLNLITSPAITVAPKTELWF